MSEYILTEEKATHQELLSLLDNNDIKYIIIESKHTINHIRKLPAINRNIGSIEWISESKDDADDIPRRYFYHQSFINEFYIWLALRHQKINCIKVPFDFSPEFDPEVYEKVKNWPMNKGYDC